MLKVGTILDFVFNLLDQSTHPRFSFKLTVCLEQISILHMKDAGRLRKRLQKVLWWREFGKSSDIKALLKEMYRQDPFASYALLFP